MGYYIRVLGQSDERIPVAALESRLRSDGFEATVTLSEGTEMAWDSIELRHTNPDAPSDGCIAIIERNLVLADSLGEGEISEFLDEIENLKPESAAKWLKNYLPTIQVVYCCQIIHDGAEWGDGWNAIHALEGEIWAKVGGILQSNGEGFSNDDGYHILWQFSDDVTGPWNMAVLDQGKGWVAFEMDLGNRAHRKSFLDGKVPNGAKLL